ncbi:hypothetical protein NPIL_216861 [Nephila pilipes]|uniref:Uncharacterized protein n=1 Tax=Nephila pilipes TaxID=299642 RepID=A0A8X6MNX1_NEPPI|nr:hypothetical protein NPIL_216861 [Nephila pilipes]
MRGLSESVSGNGQLIPDKLKFIRNVNDFGQYTFGTILSARYETVFRKKKNLDHSARKDAIPNTSWSFSVIVRFREKIPYRTDRGHFW